MEEGVCVGQESSGAQLSVCEDQVPPVGQQTEIGDEGEEDDEVVSSMSVLCDLESGISVSVEEDMQKLAMSTKMSTESQLYTKSSWAVSEPSKVEQESTYYACPDSAQQDEVVTMSTTAIEVASLGDADSSVRSVDVDAAPAPTGNRSGDGSSGSGEGRGGDNALVQSGDSYKSSYDYTAAGTSSSQYDSQADYQYQCGHKYTESQNENSSFEKPEDRSCEVYNEGEASGSEGYLMNQEHWGKGDGQQQEGYWQGQQKWEEQNQDQQWQGQYDHESTWQGYYGQGQQWNQHPEEGQAAGEEVQAHGEGGKQLNKEQQWQDQAVVAHGGQEVGAYGYEGQSHEQQWHNQDLPSDGQHDQSHYYPPSQQQYEGYQGSSEASSSKQQYYDQSAYSGQDGYSSNANQQPQQGCPSHDGTYSQNEDQFQAQDYAQAGHAAPTEQTTYLQESQPHGYDQSHNYNQSDYSEQFPVRGSQDSLYEYDVSSSTQAEQWNYQKAQHSQCSPAQNKADWGIETHHNLAADYTGQGYGEGTQQQYYSSSGADEAQAWKSKNENLYHHQYSAGYHLPHKQTLHQWQEQPHHHPSKDQHYGHHSGEDSFKPLPFNQHPVYPNRPPPPRPFVLQDSLLWPRPSTPGFPHFNHAPSRAPPLPPIPHHPYSHTQPPPSQAHAPWCQRDPKWQRWKPHNWSPYSSPTQVASSPVNSVSSDISSTSHESPIPGLAITPPTDDRPSVGDLTSGQVGDKSPTTQKTVFSQQLRDPRHSLSPNASVSKSYLKSAKYSSAQSSLVLKRKAMLKNPGLKSKIISQSKPPSIINPPHKSSIIATKESKNKASIGEPTAFPKGSLSGFKIPKHSKSTEYDRTEPVLKSKSAALPPKLREKSKTLENRREEVGQKEGSVDKEMMEKRRTKVDRQSTGEPKRGRGGRIEVAEMGSQPTSTVQEKTTTEHQSLDPPVKVPSECKLDTLASSQVKRNDGDRQVLPRMLDKSDGPSEHAETRKPHENLISLFKTLDNNTLHALASTIQLAMTSSRTCLENMRVTNETPSSDNITAQVQDDAPRQIVVADTAITNEAQDDAPRQTVAADTALTIETQDNASHQTVAADRTTADETQHNASHQTVAADTAITDEAQDNASRQTVAADTAITDEAQDNASRQTVAADTAITDEAQDNASRQTVAADTAITDEAQDNASRQTVAADTAITDEAQDNASRQTVAAGIAIADEAQDDAPCQTVAADRTITDESTPQDDSILMNTPDATLADKKQSVSSTSEKPELKKVIGTSSPTLSDSHPNQPSASKQLYSEPEPVGCTRTVIARLLSRNAVTSLRGTLADTFSVNMPAEKENKESKTTLQGISNKENKSQQSKKIAPCSEAVESSSKNANKETEVTSMGKLSNVTKTKQDSISKLSKDEPKNDISGSTQSVESTSESVLTFDVRCMYKEYNLRRPRKSGQSPPPKKSKVDETVQVSPKKHKVENTLPNTPVELTVDNAIPTISKKCKVDSTVSDLPQLLDSAPHKSASDSTEGKVSRQNDDLLAEPPAATSKRKISSLTENKLDNESPSAKKLKQDKESSPLEDKALKLSNKFTPTGSLHSKTKMKLSITRAEHPSLSPTPPPFTETLQEAEIIKKETFQAKITKKKALECENKKVLKEKNKQTNKSKKGQLLTGRLQSKSVPTQARPLMLCALCKQRGGATSLGFLYGPYRIQPDEGSNSTDIWVHEDCSVWAPGVCLVGRELKGVKEAVTDASNMCCNVCKMRGATLCCATRGCKSTYHYPCAIERGCVLNEEQFKMHCPKHKVTGQASR